MTTVLKTGVNNFFVNFDGSVSMEYDPTLNKEFVTEVNGKKTSVTLSNIYIQAGGQIVYNHGEDKFVIDDGYRNKLYSAGYLSLPIKVSEDKAKEFKELILGAFLHISGYDISYYPGIINISIDNAGYKFTFEVETINRLIDRNLKRNKIKLPMYPTTRGMDKTTSFYYRIYAKRDSGKGLSKTYEEIYNICKSMINNILGQLDYTGINHFTKTKDKFTCKECLVKGTIIKWEEDL